MGRAYSEVRVQFEQQETEGDDYFVLVQTRDPDDEFASVEVLTPEGWKPYTPDIRKYADSYMWDDRAARPRRRWPSTCRVHGPQGPRVHQLPVVSPPR